MRTNLISFVVLVCLALLAFYGSPAEACSCMPSHPQDSYCRADYVVLVRVLRKSERLVQFKNVFKVEIKKSYKMTPEGQIALKHGRIITPNSESMCGVNLQIGKLYVIAGRGTTLNACAYVKEYKHMSVIERRGFAGAYRKGCQCELRPCFGTSCLKNPEYATGCKWSPFAKCETAFSACMPSNYSTPEGQVSKCHWRRTPAYKACRADP